MTAQPSSEHQLQQQQMSPVESGGVTEQQSESCFFAKHTPNININLRLLELRCETNDQLVALPTTKYSPFSGISHSTLARTWLHPTTTLLSNSVVSLSNFTTSKSIFLGQADAITFRLTDLAGDDVSISCDGEMQIVCLSEVKIY